MARITTESGDNILIDSLFNQHLITEEESSPLLVGISGQEDFGDQTLSSRLMLSGFTSSEIIGNLLTNINKLDFEQSLIWQDIADLASSLTLTWNIGQGLLKWYRVQGVCNFPTADNGGCSVMGFQTDDVKCAGALGRQYFVQNILATSPVDVCTQLQSSKLRWQIQSMKVYSRLADPTQPDLSNCNILSEVPFSSLPECLEVALQDNLLVKTKMSILAFDNLLSVVGSGTNSIFSFTGSGATLTGGVATITGSTSSISSYEYFASGSATIGGSAYHEYNNFIITAKVAAIVFYLEANLSSEDNMKITTPANSTVKTICGACTAMPSVLYSFNNLSSTSIFSQFLSTNTTTFPDYLPMHYSKRTACWSANYQTIGYGNIGLEQWNFVFSWSCLNKNAEEYSNPFWRFSILVNKNNHLYIQKSKIDIVFPSSSLCAGINNLNVDFSFYLNTITKYVNNSMVASPDDVVIYDEIGLFKSSWTNNPILNIRLSRNTSLNSIQKESLTPIIPVIGTGPTQLLIAPVVPTAPQLLIAPVVPTTPIIQQI